MNKISQVLKLQSNTNKHMSVFRSVPRKDSNSYKLDMMIVQQASCVDTNEAAHIYCHDRKSTVDGEKSDLTEYMEIVTNLNATNTDADSVQIKDLKEKINQHISNETDLNKIKLVQIFINSVEDKYCPPNDDKQLSIIMHYFHSCYYNYNTFLNEFMS